MFFPGRLAGAGLFSRRRYRNPEEDLPPDFDRKKASYYDMLDIPLDAKAYTAALKAEMGQALQRLDKGLPENPKVNILAKRNGWIEVSPFEALPDPENLASLVGDRPNESI
jgi:hypothetical protein